VPIDATFLVITKFTVYSLQMRQRLAAFLSILSLFLSTILIPANAAAKAGGACNKAGISTVTAGNTFTCVKSGKKLVWSKGVKVTQPTLTTSKNKLAVAGGPCLIVGESKTNSQGYLECREVANNQKRYFQLKNVISDLPPQNSPVPFETCRVADQRATQPTVDNYAIAYPILWSPLKRVGSNKALFIPFDFSDNPGTGSPKELFSQDIRKFKEWIKHYSNGKFAVEVETSDTWVRASQPSKAYQPYLTHANPNSKIGFEMLLKDRKSVV
jgi:hypothetical protein